VKVFFILHESSLRNREAIALISAFVKIESIGTASDLAEALDIIRQSHLGAPIFNSGVFGEKRRDVLVSLLTVGRSVIILPKNYATNRRCVYVGVDIDAANERTDLDWVIKALSPIIIKYMEAPVDTVGELLGYRQTKEGE
jgi:hypothetical protein